MFDPIEDESHFNLDPATSNPNLGSSPHQSIDENDTIGGDAAAVASEERERIRYFSPNLHIRPLKDFLFITDKAPPNLASEPNRQLLHALIKAAAAIDINDFTNPLNPLQERSLLLQLPYYGTHSAHELSARANQLMSSVYQAVMFPAPNRPLMTYSRADCDAANARMTFVRRLFEVAINRQQEATPPRIDSKRPPDIYYNKEFTDRVLEQLSSNDPFVRLGISFEEARAVFKKTRPYFRYDIRKRAAAELDRGIFDELVRRERKGGGPPYVEGNYNVVAKVEVPEHPLDLYFCNVRTARYDDLQKLGISVFAKGEMSERIIFQDEKALKILTSPLRRVWYLLTCRSRVDGTVHSTSIGSNANEAKLASNARIEKIVSGLVREANQINGKCDRLPTVQQIRESVSSNNWSIRLAGIGGLIQGALVYGAISLAWNIAYSILTNPAVGSWLGSGTSSTSQTLATIGGFIPWIGLGAGAATLGWTVRHRDDREIDFSD